MRLRTLDGQEFDTGNAANDARENRIFVFSRWESYATSNRQAIDMNFVFDDGGVSRYDQLAFNAWESGDTTVRVPSMAGAVNWTSGWYDQVPQR